MPVTITHPEYRDNINDVIVIRDMLRGGDEAKKYVFDIVPILGNNANQVPMNTLKNQYAIMQNDLYRRGARYINFTRQTLNAIVGFATQCPGKVNLPPELEYLVTRCTPCGLSLDQLKQKIISEVLTAGRFSMLTEFPNDAPIDKLSQKTKNITPLINLFESETFTNWKSTVLNGKQYISLAVFRKEVEQPNKDIFAHDIEVQYLVLRLIDGVYTQSQLDKDDKIVIPPFQPKANGKLFDNIPLDIVGSENNDASWDIMPLQTIVELSIGHLRNSAALEDNLKKYGRGIMSITSSLPQDTWLEYTKENPIIATSETGYYLGESGAITITQLAPALAVAEAMTQKQTQILMAGGHIVQPAVSNIATDTLKLNMSDRVASLNTIVGNAEDALNNQIANCAKFLGLPPQKDKYVEFGREFIKMAADPMVMAQLLAQMNGGALPKRILLQYDKNVGLIEESEDIDALINEADNENPFAGYGANVDPNAPNGALPINNNNQDNNNNG